MSVNAKNPGLRPAGLRRAGNAGGGGGGGSVTAADITDASTAGRSMLTAANAAAQRALLSLAAIATSGASSDITDSTAAGRAFLTAASVAAQRALLSLAAIATSGASADITDSTAAGRALLTAASAAAQRTALGLAALAASGASADITDSTAAGRALLTAASVALQRTALGLATVASSGLASDLSGTIAIANGGTGKATAIAAFDALTPQGANLAGGNLVDLSTATGPTVTITGGAGVTISSFGTVAAGAKRTLLFPSSGAAIINGAAIVCPFGASITVSAGDVFEVTSQGSGAWQITGYLPFTASAWRTALGLAAMASSAVAANITDATTAGRSMLTAADAAAQRTLLGLAAMATSAIAANITDATTVGRSMLTAANQAAQTALIALATTSLPGLLAASDQTKINGILQGTQQQCRATAIGLLGTTDLYEYFDDFDRVTSGATQPSGWTSDVSSGSTVQNNSSSAEIGGTFLSAITATANSRANMYNAAQNVSPGTKDLYVAFRMAVLSGADGNSQNAMGLTTTSFGRQLVAGVIGFLSSTTFQVQFNGQVLTSGGVGLSLGVAIDTAFHLFELWIIGTTLRARIDGGAIQTAGTAVSGYTPKSGFASICATGATAAVRSHEGSWMYVASLK